MWHLQNKLGRLPMTKIFQLSLKCVSKAKRLARKDENIGTGEFYYCKLWPKS
jgi:hypothetical protein